MELTNANRTDPELNQDLMLLNDLKPLQNSEAEETIYKKKSE